MGTDFSMPSGALDELAEALEGAHSVAEAADAFVQAALRALPADSAALRLWGSGDARLLAAGGPHVAVVQPRHASDHPARGGLGAGDVIDVPDTRLPTARTVWTTRLAAAGVRSVLVIGVLPTRTDAMTLDLFAERPHAFSAEDTARAGSLAQQAGLALRLVDRIANLEEALRTRDLIGQGEGIVMERYHLTAEQAMSYLRRRSQQTNVKVRDLTRSLVAEAEGVASRDREGGPGSARASP